MGRRSWRIAKLLLLAAVPAAFLLVSVRGFVVRNAVVTAELTVVRSPIDGVVVVNALGDGMAVEAAGLGVAVRNPRSDPRGMDGVASELAEVLRAVENRQAALEWHDGTIAETEERLRAALSGLKLDLQLEQQIVQAEMTAITARIGYLVSQYDRAQRLQGSASSQAALDAAAADLDEARARLESLRLTAEQLEQRLLFLDRALPLADFAGHAVTLQDRLSEMRSQRAEIALELADLESRLVGLKERFESEQAAHAMQAEWLQEAPAGSVIWEVFIGRGGNVAAGTPLFSYVDCARRMVEVAVDDAALGLIREQHPVEVRLYGGDEPLPGRVLAIFGSAAKVTRRTTLAAHVPEVGRSDAVVLVALEPADEASRRQRICDIGRTAYVEFEGIGFLDPLIARLF